MKSFEKLNPIVQAVYYLAVLLIGMFFQHPVISVIFLIGAALFCISMQKKVFPFGWLYATEPSFYIPLFLLITITNPLFSHAGATPLFFLNDNAVTLEAFIYGAALGLMFVGIMMWGRAFSKSFTSDKYLYLFGSMLPKLSLVLSVAMRYIPLLKRRIRTVSRTQKTLGMYSSDSLIDRARSAITTTLAVVGWSLESAVETSISMKSRAYGAGKRSMYSDFKFTKIDLVIVITVILLMFGTLFGAAVGVLNFYFYPKVANINTNLSAIFSYSCFAVLALLPSILGFGEKISWKYYESKI